MKIMDRRQNNRPLWALSLLLSLAAVIWVGCMWFTVERDYGEGIHVVRGAADLKAVLAASDSIEFQADGAPFLIPTGLFIQSMAFNSSSDVNLTGYIWQKYPSDFPVEFKKGVIFPEEVNSSSTVLREEYRAEGEENGVAYELIGWYFDVTVRQSFDYSRYPLDHLSVWLRLWPGDFNNDDRILLVPDFAAYSGLERNRFGLDQDLVHGLWEIDETFFSFNNIPYDTNFGYFEFPEQVLYKELFFNLGVQRKFINAFISNLVPLLVVSLLLFASLMIVSSDERRASRFGFSTSGVIGSCSALFFVVLLAHIQVREQFAASGLVYIEYFYLIMYGAILVTALNAYIFSLGQGHLGRWLQYRDNLIPKLAYWPSVTWALALVTYLKL